MVNRCKAIPADNESLNALKGILVGRCPQGKGCITFFSREGREDRCMLCKTRQECQDIPNQSEELPDVFSRFRCGPVQDSLNFHVVSLNTSRRNMMAKEINVGCE